MELKPITISFKNTPEEIALYEIIASHSSKGAFIKDELIERLVKKNGIKESENETINRNASSGAAIDEILDI